MGIPKKSDSINEAPLPIQIEELSTFEEFPSLLKDHLKKVTKIVRFNAGSEILRQGEINKHLYFLVTGEIEVFVDGGLVANMGRMGDLIGEMSVISNRPVSATIVAKTDVELFSINAKEFESESLEDAEKVQHILYRIYSTILIDKLKITNQKAKHFEDLTKNLEDAKGQLEEANVGLEKKVAERTADLKKTNDSLEQKNTELVTSHKKIEELYSTREVTVHKLEELYSDHLKPLKNTLNTIYHKAEDEFKKDIDTSLREVKSVIAMLKPFTELYKTEQAMHNAKVLLAEPLKKQQVIAKMALGGTGVGLELASNIEDAKELVEKESPDILFLETSMFDLIDFTREKSPKTKHVFVTSDEIPNYLPKLRSLDKLPCIISRDENDRTFTVKNIVTTVSKLTSHDIFGLEKYLTWGVEVKEMDIVSSNDRESLNDTVTNYFKNLGMRRSICENCSTVIEELLMNSIYDAPVDKDGKEIYNHLDRKITVDLKPEEQGKIRYACDGMLMAVSVEDPFGALKGNVLLDYLDSCYDGRAGELNKFKGGAGRGLHQIIENSDLVVFNVNPDVKTEVIAIFDVAPKKEHIKYPSFHFFSS